MIELRLRFIRLVRLLSKLTKGRYIEDILQVDENRKTPKQR